VVKHAHDNGLTDSHEIWLINAYGFSPLYRQLKCRIVKKTRWRTAAILDTELEMWANAQRDGRPAEYRWRPLFQRRIVWLTSTTPVPCSNAAKTRNPWKFAGVPQTNETISAASGPKFTIL